MKDTKVCVLVGEVGAKEYSLLEKYAEEGCSIALMDKDKQMGQRVKWKLESAYGVSVFFFHGDMESEEDRDLFFAAVQEMFGDVDYYIRKHESG